MKTPVEYLAEATGYSADALMNEYRDHDIITPTEALEAMVMMYMDIRRDIAEHFKSEEARIHPFLEKCNISIYEDEFDNLTGFKL